MCIRNCMKLLLQLSTLELKIKAEQEKLVVEDKKKAS